MKIKKSFLILSILVLFLVVPFVFASSSINTHLTYDNSDLTRTVQVGESIDLFMSAYGFGEPLAYQKLELGSELIFETYETGTNIGAGIYFYSRSYSLDTTGKNPGTYEIKFLARTQSLETEFSTLTLIIKAIPDTTDPTITITSPTDGATYTSQRTSLNFNVYDDNLYSCTFSLNSGSAGNFPCSNGPNTINALSVEGSNTWIVTAIDDFGNTATDSVTFIVNTVIPDTTPPVITILGNNPETVELFDSYTDSGATAYDAEDGDLTSQIIKTGSVNVNVVGKYLITYTVEDAAKNIAQKTRTVNVVKTVIPDTTDPTLSITSPVNGATYTSQRTSLNFNVYDENLASCTYKLNSNPTQAYACSNGANTINALSVEGSNTWTVTAIDDAGNSITRSTIFTVNMPFVDTTPPVITILSPRDGSTYAFYRTIMMFNVYDDNLDSCTYKLNSNPTQVYACSNGDNTIYGLNSVEGSNTWTVTAKDKSGNTATDSVTFIVDIPFVDTTPPVITILGNNPETVELFNSYTDAGATAYDAEDGDLTSQIIKTGSVNVNVVGTYFITYTVQDVAGNSAQKTRTVNVVKTVIPDTTDPTLYIISPINGATYLAERTAITFNVYDKNLASCTLQLDSNPAKSYSCSNGFNTINYLHSVEGSNTWTVTAIDASGNSITKSTTFIVDLPNIDTTPPVITILGNNPETVELYDSYTDAGATAYDAEDGDLTSKIIKTGSVNTNSVGAYFITYTVEDAAGNTAQKTRTVNVIDSTLPDTTPPVITVITPQDNEVFDEDEEITFRITVNENASTIYSLDGNTNVSMNEITYLTFVSNEMKLDLGNHQVIFCATDLAGNMACKTVAFSVEEDDDGDSSRKIAFSENKTETRVKNVGTYNLTMEEANLSKPKVEGDSNWVGCFLFWALLVAVLLISYIIYLLVKRNR